EKPQNTSPQANTRACRHHDTTSATNSATSHPHISRDGKEKKQAEEEREAIKRTAPRSLI
ncbi:hypothetical protein, partial [uncultured Bifidobacterium sp.]|uniref:hypothetical protein n=1 Tax=uncultured Bifidobacterium sp. TaxID=165187 RepID=UPI00265EF112